MAEKPDASWMADFMPFFERVMKLKVKMLERGLRAARAKCLCEGGEIRAALAGKKNHIHARCGTCKRQVME